MRRLLIDASHVIAASLMALGTFAGPVGLTLVGGPSLDETVLVVELAEERLAVLADSDWLPMPEFATTEPEAAGGEPSEGEDEETSEESESADGDGALEVAGDGPAISRSSGIPGNENGLRASPSADRTRAEVMADNEKPARSSKKGCSDKDNPAIEQVGKNRYTIERTLVDRYANDLGAASKLAWVGWHRDADGEVDGFRVKGIRCGGILHEAGLRNGDVVHTINGYEIATLTGAIRAYTQLRSAGSLRLKLTRKGGEAERLRYKLT